MLNSTTSIMWVKPPSRAVVSGVGCELAAEAYQPKVPTLEFVLVQVVVCN